MPEKPTDNEEAKVQDLIDNMGKYLQQTLSSVFKSAGKEFKKQMKEASDAAGESFKEQVSGVTKDAAKAIEDAADKLDKINQKNKDKDKDRDKKDKDWQKAAESKGLSGEEADIWAAKQQKKDQQQQEKAKREALKEVYNIGTPQEKREQRKAGAKEAKQAAQDDAAIAAARKSAEADKNIAEKKKKLTEQEASGSDEDIKSAKKDLKDAESAAAKAKFQESLVGALNNVQNKLDDMGDKMVAAINDGINQSIKNYSDYQGKIEARLQGVTSIQTKALSIQTTQFGKLTENLSDIAYSPLLSASDLYTNLMTLIDEGVASNLEQKALLMTMRDDIISTFDADSPVIRKLIRVQQADSTAIRMGMESYLNRFLNEFVSSTEYLTSTFDSVASSLYEASALMGADRAAEFEYIVQKWLGTLTGVGLNEDTAQAIAKAVGELGSGDVTNIGTSGVNNLLVMAAANSGLSYADLLSKGLTAQDTNTLLTSLTTYLKNLGTQTKSNNVARSQLAQTFGLKVSDLTAANNLSVTEIENVSKEMMSYADMYQELQYQFNQITTMSGRTNVGKLVNNALKNYIYQTGQSIAANPALNTMWQITDLVQNVTGGINIPFITALGTGVDLNTTVENLMKLGIVGVSTIGQIGGIINSLSSVVRGDTLLKAVTPENSALTHLSRGTGLGEHTPGGSPRRPSGEGTSASDFVGNQEGTDYADSAVKKAQDASKNDVENAKTENKSEDETAQYLKDMQFANQMTAIKESVRDIVEKGISVNNFDYLRDKNIISGSLQGFFVPGE